MKNSTTETPEILAPAAVPWWWLTVRRPTTLMEPKPTASTMTLGRLRANSIAVAGGATRKPNTSRVPMASKFATMLSARRIIIAS